MTEYFGFGDPDVIAAAGEAAAANYLRNLPASELDRVMKLKRPDNGIKQGVERAARQAREAATDYTRPSPALAKAAADLNRRSGITGPITDPEILAEVARIIAGARRV